MQYLNRFTGIILNRQYIQISTYGEKLKKKIWEIFEPWFNFLELKNEDF